jgi:hypothetical protein
VHRQLGRDEASPVFVPHFLSLTDQLMPARPARHADPFVGDFLVQPVDESTAYGDRSIGPLRLTPHLHDLAAPGQSRTHVFDSKRGLFDRRGHRRRRELHAGDAGGLDHASLQRIQAIDLSFDHPDDVLRYSDAHLVQPHSEPPPSALVAQRASLHERLTTLTMAGLSVRR